MILKIMIIPRDLENTVSLIEDQMMNRLRAILV